MEERIHRWPETHRPLHCKNAKKVNRRELRKGGLSHWASKEDERVVAHWSRRKIFAKPHDSSTFLSSASVIAGSSGLVTCRRFYFRPVSRVRTGERGKGQSEVEIWAQSNQVSVNAFHARLPFRASSFQNNMAIRIRSSEKSASRPRPL